MRHTRSQSRSWADNAIVGCWPLPTTRHLTKPRCSAPAAEFRAQGRRRQCSVCALPPHRFARAGVEPALRSGSHPRSNGLADGLAWKSGREYITQPQPSSGSASCSWCERPSPARQGSGHAQRFCRPSCRLAFHAAARRWTWAACVCESIIRSGNEKMRALWFRRRGVGWQAHL